MKNLFLVRHAKSSWSNPQLKDFDRPLNARGLRDAPKMGEYLAENYRKPDLLISSPANRAISTARYFAQAFGIDTKDVQEEKSIYHAYQEDVLEIIRLVDNDKQSVFVFGHNPTFTSLANLFTKDYINNVPTCGVICLSSKANSWEELHEKNTILDKFYFPKMLNF